METNKNGATYLEGFTWDRSNKNSVPEQRTGNLPVIQHRQMIFMPCILRMFTYQRSWLNMVVQVNIILVKMLSDS